MPQGDCLQLLCPGVGVGPIKGQQRLMMLKLGVSLNGGTPKSSILIGFSIISHPFWVTTIFGNTQIFVQKKHIEETLPSLTF